MGGATLNCIPEQPTGSLCGECFVSYPPLACRKSRRLPISDLCIRFKKVFAHEHALYDPNVLPIHLPSMVRGHRRDHHKSQQVEGGIHPLCEFCRECFFSDDELYAHMREKHEECFVCKRNEVKDQ